MLKVVKNDEQPKPKTARGVEVIEEAAHFLRQMRFSANRGAYAEGKHVAVLIDPRWNEGNETISVLITCYAFGHRHVDWERLLVSAEPDEEGGDSWLTFLSPRGQAVASSMRAGDYHLSCLSLYPHSERVVSPVLEHRPEELALAAQSQEAPQERRVWRGQSDARILWTVEETEDGDVQVAFETQEEKFAGYLVAFYLVEPESRRVQYRGQVALEPAKTPGKWEGWCSLGSRAELKGPYELVFEVVPPGK